ncbi:MAG: HNH endonuclease [Actinomycetota bacterium]|nr:HNH endonuclease [Actinomycetota bacterium]MDQ3351614.1 HNH endonuclease [Actinomycetota bacterium]
MAALMAGIAEIERGVTQALAVELEAWLDDDRDDEFLTASLMAVERQKARLAALESRLLARFERSRVWARDGSKSVSAALARDAGLSPASAKRLVARCHKLESMPVTAAALAAGEISTDQVDLLARANQPWRDESFVDHEATLVDHCRRLRFTQLQQTIDYWCHHADAAAAERGADVHALARRCTVWRGEDGEMHVSAVLPKIAGAVVRDELNRLEQRLYRKDLGCGRVRTARQRRADALVEMATRSRRTKNGGREPVVLVNVLTGVDTFASVCELADGTVLTPGEVVPWLSAAEIERIVFDGPDRVMSVSKRRTFTGAIRRAIAVRDRHCQAQCGCDVPAPGCDIDHIVPRARGGEATQDNGRLLCPGHNRHPDRRNAKLERKREGGPDDDPRAP